MTPTIWLLIGLGVVAVGAKIALLVHTFVVKRGRYPGEGN